MLVKIFNDVKNHKWFWVLALLGLAWNISGIEEFKDSFNATKSSMISAGFTVEQAELYTNLPVWTLATFGFAVFSGTIGCILLLLRKKISLKVLGASLIAYTCLYISDIVYGVFAVFGIDEVIVLSIALSTAILMFWLARRSDKNSQLK